MIDFEETGTAANDSPLELIQEIRNEKELEEFYNVNANKVRVPLRLIHVQNAPWAKKFLEEKFDMAANDALEATMFGNLDKNEHQQRRGRNPLLRAKTSGVQHERRRKVKRAAFQCDCVRLFDPPDMQKNKQLWLPLSHYDEKDQPVPRYGTYTERIAVYVQSASDDAERVARDRFYQHLRRMYDMEDLIGLFDLEDVAEAFKYDNGHTIVIFSDASKGKPKDTLIGARGKQEARWRLISYRNSESLELNDTSISECMDYVLKDVFDSIVGSWDMILEACETHVNILEEEGLFPTCGPTDGANYECLQSMIIQRTSRKPRSFGRRVPPG